MFLVMLALKGKVFHSARHFMRNSKQVVLGVFIGLPQVPGDEFLKRMTRKWINAEIPEMMILSFQESLRESFKDFLSSFDFNSM